MEVFAGSFDKRVRFEMEYRLRNKDGQYRWVYDSGTPRFSSDGGFLGYIGSCIDITQRKESEEQLRKANEELHELKNQLEAENVYLQEELQLDQTFDEIVGQSDAIKYVLFKSPRSRPLMQRFSSWARPAPERNWWRARFMVRVQERTGR